MQDLDTKYPLHEIYAMFFNGQTIDFKSMCNHLMCELLGNDYLNHNDYGLALFRVHEYQRQIVYWDLGLLGETYPTQYVGSIKSVVFREYLRVNENGSSHEALQAMWVLGKKIKEIF